MNKRYITSESVGEGHPDKVCDQISDAILDKCLIEDPMSRVACETLVKSNNVVIAGELTTNAKIDIEGIVRSTIKKIGYTKKEDGFSHDNCDITLYMTKQSSDIAQGVDDSTESRDGQEDKYAKTGAGDQGMMYGYATNETDTYMPSPVYYAHKLVRKLAELRREKYSDVFGPDCKSQVTFVYDGNEVVDLDTILISTMHSEDATLEQIREIIEKELIPEVIPAKYLETKVRILINPTGRFVIGGPVGDAGLTGRKIIVDTYGGVGRHGGGAFSGKDGTKVDRSGAYMARYVAKNVVANGLADKCEVQLAYAIGKAEPVSVMVDTFGTGKIEESEISQKIRDNFDLRPAAIIDTLDLRRPIFQRTAAYGHFGRDDVELPWEKVVELK